MSFWVRLTILVSLVLAGCGKKEAESTNLPEMTGVSPANTYVMVCAVCHGVNGEGKEELNAPTIAGLPSWYVVEQVEKFGNGFRGNDPEDVGELIMKSISSSLTNEQLAAAAEKIERLPAIPTALIDDGDIERGRFLFAESCMPCHRFDGKGERAFHSGPLVTFNPGYLKRQLEKYARGARGSKVEDPYGQKMYSASSRLTERDIIDLVRYIGELARGDDPRTAMEK